MTTSRRRRLLTSTTVVVLLALLWVLLWGTFSAGNLLNGLLLALVVTRVFPLPDTRVGGRVHPGAALAFLGRFLVDLVTASAQVAWLGVRPGRLPVSSVVACPVRSSSELHLTVLTEALSLVPGSVVIEVRPDLGLLYAHVLDAGDDAAVEAFRARVLAVEAQVVRALGTPEDIALLHQPPRSRA